VWGSWDKNGVFFITFYNKTSFNKISLFELSQSNISEKFRFQKVGSKNMGCKICLSNIFGSNSSPVLTFGRFFENLHPRFFGGEDFGGAENGDHPFGPKFRPKKCKNSVFRPKSANLSNSD